MAPKRAHAPLMAAGGGARGVYVISVPVPLSMLRSLRLRLQGLMSPAVRTVEVEPPSAADEAGWVFLAAAFVVLGVIYVSAFERYGVDGLEPNARSRIALLPYQVLFRDLPALEQRLFREMQEGAGEAVRLRSANGDWPSVASLASAGIPPFATDVLDKAGFRWGLQREGLVANYVGVPARGTDAPVFLIFVQEPDPVTGERPPPPSLVDEEHQLLSDGTLLHVTYWKRPLSGLYAGITLDPASQGWQQIRVKSPFEEIDQR